MEKAQKTGARACPLSELDSTSGTNPGAAPAENLIEILTDEVCDHITESLEAVEKAIERRIIIRVLRKTDGNKTKASKILGIKRPTLSYKIRKLKIEID